MKENKTISIQGYPGSFHDQAANSFFGDSYVVSLLPADSFDILAEQLAGHSADFAMMAIENSIAGTILQNYRILREQGFWIIGETYLRIQHNLLVNPGTQPEDIRRVYSHPMALNQCLDYLKTLPNASLIESKDTALSAHQLAKHPNGEEACIASLHAADLTGLSILANGIETNKTNYTRFFALARTEQTYAKHCNKASVYMRIPDEKGRLLKVLTAIDLHGVNMSKLQSFPVLGKFREYFFHLDLEFDDVEQYYVLRNLIRQLTDEFTELGVYERADLREVLSQLQTATAL